MDKGKILVLVLFVAAVWCRASRGDAVAAPTTQPAAAPDADSIAPAEAGDEAPELMLYKDMPVVVAAGLRQQTQQEAAASVTVVTADDINLFNYHSLADVLRGQRSFYIHSDGLNDFVGVRGFLRPGEWNARILVLVDGRPTNEVIYGQTHVDEDFVVPMDMIKQVEIIRGPGSALYGSNAVFAVINVVTKDGADIDGVQVKAEGGTQSTGRIAAVFGTRTRSDWDILAGVSAVTTQGDSDIIYDGVHDAAHNFGHIEDSDYQGAEEGFVKVRKGEFTLQADFENRQKDNRAATYLTSFFNPGSEHEERANLTARVDHEISLTQSFHAMVYYGSYHYEQRWLNDYQVPTPYEYYTYGNDDWVGEEMHYDWQATDKLHVLAGAQGTQALYTYQHDYDTISGSLISVAPTYNSWGIFSEAEYKATNWLSVVLGGRIDHIQRIGFNASPRAALILTPTNEDTVKAMYGRAFRSPNLYEQFYTIPGFNQGNPNLRPEVSDTYEIDWEHQFKSGWRTTLDGYLWRLGHAMDDIVLADGDVQTQNVGTTWAHGIEAEVDRQWDSGARLRLYGTAEQAQHGGAALTNSPDWILGTSLAFPVLNPRTFLAIEPQVVGPQKNDLGTYVHTTFLTNIVLTSKEIAKGWDFQIGAYNIFANDARMPRDSAYNQFQPTLNYPSTQFLASFTYHF